MSDPLRAAAATPIICPMMYRNCVHWKAGGAFLALVATLFALTALGEVEETRPFAGVRYLRVTEREPLPLAVHLVEVDLSQPGLRFSTTEPNGDAPRETWTETTREYVRRVGAQIGINGSFFANDDEPHTDILGIGVSGGVRYSTWRSGQEWGVNFGPDNAVTIIGRAHSDSTGYETLPPVALYNAVAGNLRLLRDGNMLTVEEGKRHPRTAVGLTKDRKLLLLVVDGRHPDYSAGMTCHELAEFLRKYGAVDAVNLDGGGSSTLVFADPEPRVVNVPIPIDLPEGAPVPDRGIERKVGNNIAVFVPRAAAVANPIK